MGQGWEGGQGEMGEICNIVNNSKKNLKQEHWCGDLGSLEEANMHGSIGRWVVHRPEVSMECEA